MNSSYSALNSFKYLMHSLLGRVQWKCCERIAIITAIWMSQEGAGTSLPCCTPARIENGVVIHFPRARRSTTQKASNFIAFETHDKISVTICCICGCFGSLSLVAIFSTFDLASITAFLCTNLGLNIQIQTYKL